MSHTKTMGFGSALLHIIKQTLFPLQCASCGKEGSFLCNKCETKLPFLETITTKRKTKQSDIENITECFSVFAYQEPISSLIILGKYSFVPEVFEYLANLASAKLAKQLKGFPNSLICPIPLNRQRQRWRGFNQSQIIANTFAKQLNMVCTPIILRTKNTKTQKDLSAKDRMSNTRNSFTINPELNEKQILNQTIILIDDVVTTGSTLAAAAAAILPYKPSKIMAITLAKD